MELRHSASPRPAPKNSECKNLLVKFSLRFFGIKTASSSLIIFQRAKLPTRIITHLCRCNWMTFWKKKRRGRVTKGVLFLHVNVPTHRALQSRRNWHIWAFSSWSSTLFSESGPVGLPSEKTIKRSPFFFRRGCHCCREDLVGRTRFWIFFWVACKS